MTAGEKKRIQDLEKEVKELKRVVERLYSGSAQLEKLVRNTETLARRGVNNAATNATSISALKRKITKRD